MNFFTKLNLSISRNNSLLVIGLDPNPEMLPQSYLGKGKTLSDSLGYWLKSIIEKTSDLVCAYRPTLGLYYALGTEGLALLDEVLKTIPEDIPIILDAKHGDLNTSTIFAQTIFEQWQVDAVTLNPYSGQDNVAPFLLYGDKAAFILTNTSNPAAPSLQEYPTPESPFYLHLVEEAKTWGTPEQIALEVGSASPDIFAKIRKIAPERTILARSIWSEGSDFQAIVTAGLNDYGDGLLIPVPLDCLKDKEPRKKIITLQTEVNNIRNNLVNKAYDCQVWSPNVCFLNEHPYQDLILQLYDIGCLLFGEYVQASGATFSYYIDLRKIISNPQIFNQVLMTYAKILKKLTFDRIAGIPYGSLPTATGLSLMLNHPMIFPRKEVKAHGTRRLIEGNYQPGEKVVIVEDILITGKSAIEGAEKIKSAGLEVEDIVVFIDHEGGVKERIKQQGYCAHSVLKISEITETLYEAGKISEEQYKSLT